MVNSAIVVPHLTRYSFTLALLSLRCGPKSGITLCARALTMARLTTHHSSKLRDPTGSAKQKACAARLTPRSSAPDRKHLESDDEEMGEGPSTTKGQRVYCIWFICLYSAHRWSIS